jgi:DNA-binding CsgD family transcriptional regulator
MTIVPLRSTSVHPAAFSGPRDGAAVARRSRPADTRDAGRFRGAILVLDEAGRFHCTESARTMLLAASLFERDVADRAALRPHAAVRDKLEELAEAARDGDCPVLLLWAPAGAAYLATAGLVPLGAAEVVSLDIRPLSTPMWSNRDLADAFGLTEREADVTRCLLLGDPVPSIAARLRLKSATVRHYLKLIYSKTATSSQAQLVAMLTGGLRRDDGDAPIVRFPGQQP